MPLIDIDGREEQSLERARSVKKRVTVPRTRDTRSPVASVGRNGYENRGSMSDVQPRSGTLQDTRDGTEEKGDLHLREESKGHSAHPEEI